MKTQREKAMTDRLKVIALTEYINFCIRYNEVPKEEIQVLINGCGNIEALREVTETFKNK